MVRQRRTQASLDSKKNDKGANSSSSNGSSSLKNSKVIKETSFLAHSKKIIVVIVLGIAICFGYMGYLETRINTPFNAVKVVQKSGLEVPELFWGSYRPGNYFGLKTRDPNSIVTGLMWYFPMRLRPGGDGFRHWCQEGDNLKKYGWLEHDGRNFGVQEIIDGPFNLTTSFVKRVDGSKGGEWTARISVDYVVKPKKNQEEDVSLIWYTALDEQTTGYLELTNSKTKLTGIKGYTSVLGDFTIKFMNSSGTLDNESYLRTTAPGLQLLKETVVSSLRLAQEHVDSPKKIVLAGDLLSYAGDEKIDPNFVAVQLAGKVPFTIDIIYESSELTKQESLSGETYTKALNLHRHQFERKFEEVFNLKSKGYKKEEIVFAQAALSNMIGGIGYFYGASKVQSSYTSEPVNYWKAPLYTAVPSRSFFPRGFLWDEGFHGLLISQWDVDVELDIMGYWFDLLNAEGWIPRELILGAEALAKVPSEFVIQHNSNANPPTFLLTVQSILNRYGDRLTEEQHDTLERLYPRLQAWFAWFNVTQKGDLPGSYRWRGRDPVTVRELNPKTMSSGFDDYPRASHPTEEERHVDLYCWMAMAAKTLAVLARILKKDGYRYEQTANYLMDNRLMNELHWSEFAERYADYGLHTDAVKLERPKPPPRSQYQNMEMQRVVMKKPEYRLVDSTFGYVSLFPFLLHILDADSPKLEKVLKDIQNPDLLWTPYGLRSLSKSSSLYMERNTEHDPPYWRGPIWINLNFLATRALYHYSKIEGPYKSLAEHIYTELRENIISNLIKQYYKTGYLWEQYNDKTGEGIRSHPFNGWSSLVVIMMGEYY